MTYALRGNSALSGSAHPSESSFKLISNEYSFDKQKIKNPSEGRVWVEGMVRSRGLEPPRHC